MNVLGVFGYIILADLYCSHCWFNLFIELRQLRQGGRIIVSKK